VLWNVDSTLGQLRDGYGHQIGDSYWFNKVLAGCSLFEALYSLVASLSSVKVSVGSGQSDVGPPQDGEQEGG
jgi:hypothetical protein